MTDQTRQSTAEKMRSKIEDTAENAAEKMRSEATDAADQVLDRAEDETRQAARAADAAADEFDSGTFQAQAARQVAAGLEHVAATIRDTDLRQTASQVTRFARDNPVVFLGGAALIGFAAARFMKSSKPRGRYAHDGDDPWSGHVTSTPLDAEHQTGRFDKGRSQS